MKVGELWAELGLDTSKFVRGTRKADDALEGFTRKSKSSSNQIAAGFLKAQAAWAGVTQVMRAATAELGAMVDASSRSVEVQNLFEVSFGEMAGAAEDWATRTQQAIGVNDTTLKEMSGTLFNMVSAMGIGKDAAFEMSTGFTELALDASSFFNLPFDEAFNKIRSGLAGETEPLKQLGILVTENAMKQLDWVQAIEASGRGLSEQEKVIARAQLIQEGLANAQGDLIRTQDSWANQTRLIGEAWTDFREVVGGFVTESPALESALGSIKDFIVDLTDSIKNNKEGWEEFTREGLFLFIAMAKSVVQSVGAIGTALDNLEMSYLLIKNAVMGYDHYIGTKHLETLRKVAEKQSAQGALAMLPQITATMEKIQSIERAIDANNKAISQNEVAHVAWEDSIQQTVRALEDAEMRIIAAAGAADKQSETTDQTKKSVMDLGGALGGLAGGPGADFLKWQMDSLKKAHELALAFEKEAMTVDQRMNPAVAKHIGALQDFVPWTTNGASAQKKLTEETASFADVLEQAANLSIVFKSSLASVFSGAASALGGLEGLFGKDELTGKSGFSKFAAGFKSEGKVTFGSFVSGLTSALPMIAAVAGPMFSLLSKLFKPEWKKLAEEGARVFGQELSENLSRELVDVADRLGSTQNAFAARIGDIIAEVGISSENSAKILEHFGYLLGMVENGTLDWAEAAEQVDKAFGPIVEHLETLGTEGLVAIGELVSRMRELGEVSAEVQAYIEQKASSAVENLGRFFEYLAAQETLTAEQAEAALVQMQGAFSAALQATGSLLGAMEMLGPSFGELLGRMREVLGEENAMLNAMTQYYNFVKNNKEQLAALDGLSQGFKDLLSIGIINKDNINDFAESFRQQFESILGSTENQTAALAAMGPQIGMLLEAYQSMGLQVPEWLAEMADAAKEAGVSLEPPEGLPDILADIRDILLDVAAAWGVAAGEADRFNRAASGAAGSSRPSGPPRGGRDEGFQKETPPEGLLFRRPQRIVVGEVPEVVTVRHASRDRDAGGGGVTENHFHFEEATILDKHGLVEMLSEQFRDSGSASRRLKDGINRIGG